MADDSLFPHEVARQANDGNQKNDEVEHSVGPQSGHYATILGREPDSGGDHSVQRQKEHGKDERPRNGCYKIISLVRMQNQKDINLPATVYFVQRLSVLLN